MSPLRRKSVLVPLVLIAALSALLLSYELGERNFQEDEYSVIGAAAAYLATGEFGSWDWLEAKPGARVYDRAWPHTLLVAQSFRLFGISEWSARLVSVVFGVLTVFVAYGFAFFFTKSRLIALFTCLAFALYPRYIETFRYTRMYAVLIPWFLFLSYAAYRAITGSRPIPVPSARLDGFLRRNLDFHYPYLLAVAALIYPSRIIHFNSLILLPSVFVFVVLLALLTRERKYVAASVVGLGGMAAVFLLRASVFSYIVGYLTPFEKRNFVYGDYLAGHPLPGNLGVFLLALGGLGSLTALFLETRRRGAAAGSRVSGDSLATRLVYLHVIVFVTAVYFIFVARRYAHFLYTSHVAAIAIALIVSSYFFLGRKSGSKAVQAIFALLLVAILGHRFHRELGSIYGNDHPLFVRAYRTIVESLDPEKDVIFGQFLRGYYLQDLEKKPEIVNMLRRKQYEYGAFLEELKRHESGWITWETRKGPRELQEPILDYVDANFRKMHGEGVDDTKVEVYYFDKSMVK